jgi:glycosyltransferase involved in cell wall biosynthesis
VAPTTATAIEVSGAAETAGGGEDRRPKVSVFVLTHDHVAWVGRALDSALAQKAPFEFELLVADDCSRDGTREIVNEYARREPARIRIFLPERNLGIAGIWLQAARQCRGEYVAILEGDDYWTSSQKIARQAALMDSRPAWSSCFHRATLFHEDCRLPSRPATPAFERDEFELDDVLRACFIPFLTVMFRRDVLATTPDWLFSYRWFDWLFHIWCARRGAIGFLDEDMAAYRVHDRGNWSARDRAAQLHEDLKVYERLLQELPQRRALIELCVENRHCQLAVEAARVPVDTPVALLDSGASMPAYFNGRRTVCVGLASAGAAAVESAAAQLARLAHPAAPTAGASTPTALHYRPPTPSRTEARVGRCACVLPRSVEAALPGQADLVAVLADRGTEVWSDEWCRILEFDVDSSLCSRPAEMETAERMGALVEIAEVTPVEAPAGLHGGFLDEPRPGAVLDTRAVDVIGWALGAQRRAVAAEFAIGERVFWRAPLRAERPDLATAFPDHEEAGQAGFRTTLNLVGTPAQFELNVSIVLEGQQRAPLATIRGRHRWRRDRSPAFAELVSVVIPCYQQAQYLGEAIESVLAQSYPHVEVLVIDDSSTDNASQIASRYPGVRCVREPNAGMAGARNAGVRATNGDFLVFLDADDRLLPEAIETGMRLLAEHPECAAAIGAYRRTSYDGQALPTHSQPAVASEQYARLMRENWAGFPGRAIYRRSLFEHVRGFDPTVDAAADFAFNLAVAREFPICSHETVVAEHREHGRNVSARADKMLVETLAAMRQQRRYVRRDPQLRRAYREGARHWKRYWGALLAAQARESLRARRLGKTFHELAVLARRYPAGLVRVLRPERARNG